MSRTLVVVTCLQHRWNFTFLCNTLQKYVEPCKFIVVCNGTQHECDEFDLWFKETLFETLHNFDVTVIGRHDILSTEYDKNFPGWYTQQFLKLGVSSFVETDEYVVLDSKNFFTSHIDIGSISRNRYIDILPEHEFFETVVKTFEYFDMQIPVSVKLINNTTPYVINTKVINTLCYRFNGIDSLSEWLLSNLFKKGMAEFFLYGIFERYVMDVVHETNNDINAVIFSQSNFDDIEYFPKENCNATIYGINGWANDIVPRSKIFDLFARLKCDDCIPSGLTPPYNIP